MRNRTSVLAVLLLGALLSGCEQTITPDQCLRREIFQQCMNSLPAGPQSTKYNDWDEVIGACGNAAYYQSYRKKKFVKESCAAF